MVVITSFSPPVEGIKHQQSATMAFINDKALGKGTLYIAESQFSWVDSASGSGFSLQYPHLGVHAVMTEDLETESRQCLFVLVDADIDFSAVSRRDDIDDEQGHDFDEYTELKFVPDDPSTIHPMFSALSECQTLHRDEKDSISEDDEEEDDEEDEFDDAEEGFLCQTNGNHADEMEVEGQFDDADDAGFQEH